MVQAHSRKSIFAFEFDLIRDAFRRSVIEDAIPEEQWRHHAGLLIRAWTGSEAVDPALLDWIVGPEPQ